MSSVGKLQGLLAPEDKSCGVLKGRNEDDGKFKKQLNLTEADYLGNVKNWGIPPQS